MMTESLLLEETEKDKADISAYSIDLLEQCGDGRRKPKHNAYTDMITDTDL